MAPNAQSGRGPFFVILPLFTQDLRGLSTEETQSTSILPGWARPVALAASPWPAMGDFCNLEKPTHRSLTEWSPDNLAGAGRCNTDACEDS